MPEAGGQPLAAGDRPRRRGVTQGGKDVRDIAYGRVAVEDGDDLGHTFTVAFLSRAQPGGQVAAGGRLRGARPQRFVAHDHPLGVRAHAQRQLRGRRVATLDLLIEGVDVGGGAHGQRLDLAGADTYPGGSLNRLPRLGERAAGGLHGGQPAKPVGVLFHRQVTGPIGRMQISMPGLPVGDPPDDDLTDHGGQRPVPAGLGAPPHHPVGVDNLRQPRFPCRAQVVVFLQALPGHLAETGQHLRLHLGVGEPGRVGPGQPADRLLEPHAGLRERVRGRLHRVR